jgi:hypothetical protein
MKTGWKTLTVIAAIVIVSGMLAPAAQADCGFYNKGKTKLVPQAWDGRAATLLPISAGSSIVGMWHVTFTAEGNPGGPPDGTPIDNALVTWHADNTEIMNSARPPQDGQFCMGVWEQVGPLKYRLNHFAWSGNDTENAPSGIGNPAGPTHITEQVTLGSGGKHFTGHFTLDAYDLTGNVVAHIVGKVEGTRITMSTKVSDLL